MTEQAERKDFALSKYVSKEDMVRDMRATIEAQYARIAELEAKLQAKCLVQISEPAAQEEITVSTERAQALADEIERMHKQFAEDMTARFGELPAFDEMSGEYIDPVHQTAWLAYNYGAEQAARRDVVPQGWKLVPVEPTNSMESAGGDAINDPDLSTSLCECAAVTWAAMLAAAPSPPEARKVPELSTERKAMHTAMCANPDSSLKGLEARWSEVAQVQLPAPRAFIQTDIVEDEETMPVNHELIWPSEKDASKKNEALYDEQQVRALLAGA